LHVRASRSYYAIVGTANGGTLTVYDRASRTLVRDDGGYVGELEDGRLVTSQVTERRTPAYDRESVAAVVTFHHMRRDVPTPARFVMLRLLNLTVMRSVRAGNAIKRAIVGRLIAPQRPVSLRLERRFVFRDRIEIRDRFESGGGLVLRWLHGGRPFTSIHMASTGYYEGAALRAGASAAAIEIDVAALARDRVLERVEQLS
jgi:hypothetical protein